MKQINTAYIRVFVKEDEDKDTVRKSLVSLLPFDLEEQKVRVDEKKVEGFNDKKIIILRVTLDKDRHINPFLHKLSKNLGSEKETLLQQLDTRLDDNLNLFIRLDKERLLEGKYVLTDSGNCFHIKMNVAAFPKRKEAAVTILKQLFK